MLVPNRVKVNRLFTGEWILENPEVNENTYLFSKEDLKVEITNTIDGCDEIVSFKLSMNVADLRQNDALGTVNPVIIEFTDTDEISRVVGMHLNRDWWTTPVFTPDYSGLEERTQFIFVDENDTKKAMLLTAGKYFKAMGMKSEEKGCLTVALTAYKSGYTQVDEKIIYSSKDESLYKACHKTAKAYQKDNGIMLREEKPYPEMFEYLGWCSWDAFYTKVNAEGIRAKAEELKQKDVPVRWMLIDDGWMSSKDARIYDFVPDKEKFPDGFKKLTDEIKADGKVKQVGVWHALGGYWNGVIKDSVCDKGNLYELSCGKYVPNPETCESFYSDWYEYLSSNGIDFTKVDGQSQIKNYFLGDKSPCDAARKMHKGLESASDKYMNGYLINCMGMAMENILGRGATPISRNSNDFVPDDSISFATHLKENSFNGIYHSLFYHCDWDMFWTFHKDAEKHALLRAISGGPIYFSDRVGDTKADVVAPLCYSDGKIIRMSHCAMVCEKDVFVNPDNNIIKVCNVYDNGNTTSGAVAVYNLSDDKTLGTKVYADDVSDLNKDADYVLYDWNNKCIVENGYEITLAGGGFALILVIPKICGVAVIGLKDKYMSAATVESITKTENGIKAVIHEGGNIAFMSNKAVKSVLVNGAEADFTCDNGIYCVKTEGNEAVEITVNI